MSAITTIFQKGGQLSLTSIAIKPNYFWYRIGKVGIQQTKKISGKASRSFRLPTNTMSVPGRPTWQQSMLRITNPEKSLAFYTGLLGV